MHVQVERGTWNVEGRSRNRRAWNVFASRSRTSGGDTEECEGARSWACAVARQTIPRFTSHELLMPRGPWFVEPSHVPPFHPWLVKVRAVRVRGDAVAGRESSVSRGDGRPKIVGSRHLTPSGLTRGA